MSNVIMDGSDSETDIGSNDVPEEDCHVRDLPKEVDLTESLSDDLPKVVDLTDTLSDEEEPDADKGPQSSTTYGIDDRGLAMTNETADLADLDLVKHEQLHDNDEKPEMADVAVNVTSLISDLKIGNTHITEDDSPTKDEVELSIHVSQSDLSMFGEPETSPKSSDENKHSYQNGTYYQNGNDDENENNQLVVEDESVSQTTSVETETADTAEKTDKENIIPPISKLHCAYCGNLFTDPKILNCLHSFCYQCLEMRREQRHRYIYCPLCECVNLTSRTVIPKGGISDLPDNTVASNLITAKSLTLDSNCVICQLHNLKKESTGQCIDCGDVLCSECCEKHTFSRLTATHTVVSLENLDTPTDVRVRRKKQISYCVKHPGEEYKFFCENCQVIVCRDCILLEHSSHKCVTPDKAFEKRTMEIVKLVESLKVRVKSYEADTDESLDVLMKMEAKELKCLDNAKKKLIKAIENKHKEAAEKLKLMYDGKRNVVDARGKYKARTIESVNNAIAQTEFFVQEGKATEIIPLEGFLKDKLKEEQLKMENTFGKFTSNKVLPKVKMVNDNIKTVEAMTFFIVEDPYNKDKQQQQQNTANKVLNEKHIGGKTPVKKSKPGANSNNVQSMNVSRNVKQNMNQNANQYKTGSASPSVLALNLGNHGNTQSIGRGRALQAEIKSLLGEYTSPNDRQYPDLYKTQQDQRLQEKQSRSNQNLGSHGNQTKKGHQGQQTQNMNSDGCSSIYRQQIQLNFQSEINIMALQDKLVPDIVGLTFLGAQKFAVCDAENQRIKLISSSGNVLHSIEDPGPMTITACQDLLIWNSVAYRVSQIKVFDTNCMKELTQLRMTNNLNHPVTTFKNEKYMVANVNHSRIEAYQQDGSHVHTMNPHTREGKVLDNVSRIATCTMDQLVIIDSKHKRVIVNDFDGTFVGEYFENGWEPHSVCIDHNDNIFVVDSAGSRLVYLSSRGVFMNAWKTNMETPRCVAVNGRGIVLVSGKSRNVDMYQYA